jgi:hypothetical protein
VDEDQLERLDHRGYVVLDAITYDRGPPAGSHASPHAFICMDGGTYWVKRTAQQGLAVELIAGRLGVRAGAAPVARIVRVGPSVQLPADGSADHLRGIGVGSRDQPGMENLRHLGSVLPSGQLDPAKIDLFSRARVLAFQTWLGVQDTQILVDLRDGKLMSIDHGDWAATLTTGTDPTIVQTPGVADDVGRGVRSLEVALRRIREITDEQLLDAVARMPTDPEWNADRSRRLEVARWLRWRRERLTGVMRVWRTS